MTSSTDPAGVTTTTTYGPLSEPLDTTVGGVLTEHREYDSRGHLLVDKAQGRPPTTYTWAGGRPVTVTDPTGSVTTLAYNPAGYLASVTSAAGTVSRITDSAGKVQGVVSPSGAHTGFQYDGDGNLTALVGDNNLTQTWAYDPTGHVTTATDKLNHDTRYSYDNAGNLLTKEDRNNRTKTTYVYDANGQLAKVSYPGSVTTIVRNGFGQPISMTNPAATINLAWSLSGQLQSETTDYAAVGVPDQTVTYAFNGGGQPTQIAGQGSPTSFGYDPQGRLSSVDDSVAGAFGYSYDPSTGLPAALSRPNGITDHFTFDANARLTARNAVDSAAGVVNKAEYTYNPEGLRDSLADLAGTHGYTYDLDGRLTAVTNPPGGVLPDETFTYDSLGNRTSWNDNPANQVTYSNADQLTQDATFTYRYDNEGNLIWKKDRVTAKTTQYTWDAAHHLTKITDPNGHVTSYAYDPLGRRISATDPSGTTYSVWAGANLRATLDPTGTVTVRIVTNPTRLSDTLAITTAAATTYPLMDGLGSTTATTNPTGDVTSRTAYTAYGTPSAVAGTDDPSSALAGYTGYPQDPTGLDYARARYYSPQTGTFLSQDPVPSANLYAYAAGDPANRADPTGEFDIAEESILNSRVAQEAFKGGFFGFSSGISLCAYDPLPREVPPSLGSVARDYVLCVLKSTAVGAMSGAAGGALFKDPMARLDGYSLPGASLRAFACMVGAIEGIFTDNLANYAATGHAANWRDNTASTFVGCGPALL